MKAEIYKFESCWYGRVHANWLLYGKGWRNVTSKHYTKLGAEIALKYWLLKNKRCDVEIRHERTMC